MQTLDIGTARENTVSRFLQDHLPGRYIVSSGELVDTHGNHSGQTDIMIYDGSTTQPLMSDGDNVLLPAEALLATVEVKSFLDQTEVDKSIKGIGKMHNLKPWDKSWGVSHKTGDKSDELPRILCSIFAYGSNLVKEGWAENEMSRFRERAKKHESSIGFTDRIVVLNRGVLIPSLGKARELTEEYGALSVWFFSLVNFLDREVRRRKPFPWDSYQLPDKKSWRQVLPPQFDAPGISIPTQAKRKRDRRKALSKNTDPESRKKGPLTK